MNKPIFGAINAFLIPSTLALTVLVTKLCGWTQGTWLGEEYGTVRFLLETLTIWGHKLTRERMFLFAVIFCLVQQNQKRQMLEQIKVNLS